MANTGTDIGALTEALNEKLDRDVQNPANLGKEEIAHLAMPSDKYIDLALPDMGASIVTPADGFLSLKATVSSGACRLVLRSTDSYIGSSVYDASANGVMRCTIPVRKEESIVVGWNGTFTSNSMSLRFYYANGTQHLAPQS